MGIYDALTLSQNSNLELYKPTNKRSMGIEKGALNLSQNSNMELHALY